MTHRGPTRSRSRRRPTRAERRATSARRQCGLPIRSVSDPSFVGAGASVGVGTLWSTADEVYDLAGPFEVVGTDAVEQVGGAGRAAAGGVGAPVLRSGVD